MPLMDVDATDSYGQNLNSSQDSSFPSIWTPISDHFDVDQQNDSKGDLKKRPYR